MMNKSLLTILCLLLIVSSANAQRHVLSGYVTDKASGEALWGATVYDMNSKLGVATNNYGYFSLLLPGDTVKLRISFVGYQSVMMVFFLDIDKKLNVELESSIELKEVQVIAEGEAQVQDQVRMSSIDISMESVQNLPVFMGEKDIMKTIQLMPGVQSGAEGTSGLYVRGGSPGQNLILLDGVPVYNVSHLFGFFSVFNANSIKSVKLIKGGFPANYGGRLSSVVDIRMKEGNMKKIHGQGSIGLIAANFTLEGPIIKDKTSFVISGRRTYIDLLAKPFIRSFDDAGTKVRGGYYFYDINAKINHKFSDKHRLFLSGYFGRDKFYNKIESNYEDYKDSFDTGLKWGNIIAALRWNYLITPRLFSNTTVTYSKYKFNVNVFNKEETFINGQQVYYSEFTGDYFSGIRDYSVKSDFNWMVSPGHQVIFGAGYTNHYFTPGIQQFKNVSTDNSNQIDTVLGATETYANEFWAYAEDEWSIGERLVLNFGFHASAFDVENTFYYSVQPRISGRFMIDKKTSVKASYVEMQQYLHLLSNVGIGLPTDLWVPATSSIKPQFSRQVAMGFARTFYDKFEVSIEGYYKWMDNLITYKEGAGFFSLGSDWQNLVESGKGWAYGVEFLISKKVGKTTGWIGYTLAWSNRQFENINFGNPYPYRYDRRHDISVSVTHKFNDKIDIGVVWVYGTGNAVTLGLERYLSFDGASFNNFYDEVEYIEKRNNYRMPAYHRLDIGVNFRKKRPKWERTWSVGFYNIYNRKNPFYLYFKNDYSGNKKLYLVSLFPILPSISYNFKF